MEGSRGGGGEKSTGGRTSGEKGPAQRLGRHGNLQGTSNEDRERRGNPQTNGGRAGRFQFQVSPQVSHTASASSDSIRHKFPTVSLNSLMAGSQVDPLESKVNTADAVRLRGDGPLRTPTD